ncbi:MAG: alpha/beta hydrolase [Xanthomonadales bacterium]|nr:alpha/beta hydrolase [Xanthomonadales bacterium]
MSGWVVTTALALLLAACGQQAEEPTGMDRAADPQVAETESPDGVKIRYEERGNGRTALVLVHCWACNRSFWKSQFDAFQDQYRVVAMDLGGHGESGSNRRLWRIAALAEDVKAVADQLQLDRIILVGHSMGGPVSLEAARLMPGRVLGVVAVDTLHDADFEYPPGQLEQMVTAFETDFHGTMSGVFQGMSGQYLTPDLKDFIVTESLNTRPDAAVALLRNFDQLDLPEMFRQAGVPIRAINAAPGPSTLPTDIEGNRQLADFDAVLMEQVGHFLQLEQPEAFNQLLRGYVDALNQSAAQD